jgi:hypothetical protein
VKRKHLIIALLILITAVLYSAQKGDCLKTEGLQGIKTAAEYKGIWNKKDEYTVEISGRRYLLKVSHGEEVRDVLEKGAVIRLNINQSMVKWPAPPGNPGQFNYGRFLMAKNISGIIEISGPDIGIVEQNTFKPENKT